VTLLRVFGGNRAGSCGSSEDVEVQEYLVSEFSLVEVFPFAEEIVHGVDLFVEVVGHVFSFGLGRDLAHGFVLLGLGRLHFSLQLFVEVHIFVEVIDFLNVVSL